MTPNDISNFQSKLGATVGKSITVKVDHVLTDDDREKLINWLRQSHDDPDAVIKIIEPVSGPPDGLKFELVDVSKETAKAPQEASQDNSAGVVDYIYGNSLIVMQNRLLNAITNLSLNERRLIMFLSPIVRKTIDENPSQRTFNVSAIEFADEYSENKKRSNIYKALEDVADSLLERAFFFWDFSKSEKGNKKGVSWVAECEYIKGEGRIEVTLTDTVTEMLTVFDKSHPFTKYERQNIVNLGSYGVILFELISSCLHQKNPNKSYAVNYLREKFNCIDKYESVTDFRLYVLKKAITEIEQNTPLKITVKPKKVGNSVTEMVFSFKDTSKKNKDMEKIDNENPYMSVPQATKYAILLKKEHQIVGSWKGDYNDAETRIIKELQDPALCKKYLKYLSKIPGFKQTSLKRG